MKNLIVLLLFVLSSLAFGQTATLTPYTIVAHTGYKYTVRHGRVIMKVEYHESQTSVCKDGDKDFIQCLGTGLHLHTRYGVYPHDADLGQVPEVGLRINQCVLSKTLDNDGDPIIATQPTPEPCMMQNGNTLHYEPSPNGPILFAYVNFDITSEKQVNH
jgi:hypothetical protein